MVEAVMSDLDKVKRRAASLESPPEVKRLKPDEYKPHISKETQEKLASIPSEQPSGSTIDPPPELAAEENPPLSFEELREIMMASETRFANNDRKKAIAQRCKELDFDELLEMNEIRQVVPIVPDKLEVEYRTLSGSEDYTAKNLAGDLTIRAHRDRLQMYYLSLAIVRVNSKEFPPFRVKGEFNQKAFEQRVEAIMKLPEVLLVDLHVNLRWFRERVEDILLDQKPLKNG
jgi:hypothetical protein